MSTRALLKIHQIGERNISFEGELIFEANFFSQAIKRGNKKKATLFFTTTQKPLRALFCVKATSLIYLWHSRKKMKKKIVRAQNKREKERERATTTEDEGEKGSETCTFNSQLVLKL